MTALSLQPTSASRRSFVSDGFNERQLASLLPEIVAYLFVIAVCAILDAFDGTAVINVIAPIAIIVLTGAANFRMVREDRYTLLTPLFAFRIMAMVMLGVGGVFNTFADDYYRDGLTAQYGFVAPDAAKIFLIWLVGIVLTLIGAATVMKAAPSRVAAGAADDETSVPQEVLGVGLGAFVLLTLLSVFEVVSGSALIPNAVETLLLAIALMGFFALGLNFDRSWGFRITAVGTLSINLFVALLLANKSYALLPTAIFLLGYLTARLSVTRLAVGALLLVVMFGAINPVVIYARGRLAQLEDGLAAGVGDRVAIINDYLDGDRLPNQEERPLMGRIDFLGPASFVVGQFDRGQPAEDLRNSAYMLVPRVIWPDKPITSGAGLTLNYLLGYQGDNQVAVTVLGDLYWNLGWVGVSLSLLIGAFIGLGSIVSRSILIRKEWLMMPFVFAALRVGLNIEGTFAAGIMVPIIACVLLYYGLRVAEMLVLGVRSSRAMT